MVRLFGARVAKNFKVLGKAFLFRQRIQRWKDLQLGEVSGSSKDGEDERFVDFIELHSGALGVPFGMKASFLVGALVGVSTKIISKPLNHIGRQMFTGRGVNVLQC